MVGAAGWWIAIVELVPAEWRPYIGGSQTDSILELTLGYNGLGRLTGEETGSVGGGMDWGDTGLDRLFGDLAGGQIAWLLPAALVLGAAVVWITRRGPRTDTARAGVVLWGGWLVVTAVVFAWMRGIYHDYYLVALAPAIAGLVGIGTHVVWSHRHHLAARLLLAGTVAGTAWWSSRLLGRAGDWYPWIAQAVLVAGLAAAVAVVVGERADRRLVPTAGLLGMLAVLAGPAAYSVATAATPREGAIVTAGPMVSVFPGGPGGFPTPGGQGGGAPQAGPPLGAEGQPDGQRGNRTAPPTGIPGGSSRGARPSTGPECGVGGLLGATEPSQEVVDLLLTDADDYTWVAATVGANNAAGFQLATERSVLPIGGFNGTDPSPTVAEFQQLVADGEVHWYIDGGMGGGPGDGSDEAQSIAEWVTSTFAPVTVDGVTFYDLTTGA